MVITLKFGTARWIVVDLSESEAIALEIVAGSD